MKRIEEEIRLIDGKFDPEEAKELLLNIIGNKIQFHNTKNFSSEICFGKPDQKSLEKLLRLREAREIVIDLLKEASRNNCSIQIQSRINISFEQREGVEKGDHNSV